MGDLEKVMAAMGVFLATVFGVVMRFRATDNARSDSVANEWRRRLDASEALRELANKELIDVRAKLAGAEARIESAMRELERAQKHIQDLDEELQELRRFRDLAAGQLSLAPSGVGRRMLDQEIPHERE